MMIFNDFIEKSKLKKKATSNIKKQQFFSCSGMNNVGIYLRDAPFSTDIGNVNWRHSKGTHRVADINESFFDSSGCICPKKLSKFIIKRNGYCLYSEYQIQKKFSFCGSYCL